MRLDTQVVGLLLTAFLGLGHDVEAACFKGSFVDGVWTPSGCSILEPADAANQCLSDKNLLFMGDSTTREIFLALCSHLSVEVHRHPCNMHMGWGCHDCHRGCHSPAFNRKPSNGMADRWVDLFATTASGTALTFTWKPEMLTVDDLLFLKQFVASNNNLDAVIVHKGIHEAMDFKEFLKPVDYSENKFEQELSTRAEILAETLKDLFPSSTLLWRESFYNGKDAELEEFNSRFSPIIQARFRQEGFHVLPGHHVSRSAHDFYNETDGLHPHDSVNAVMLSMIADVLCYQVTE